MLLHSYFAISQAPLCGGVLASIIQLRCSELEINSFTIVLMCNKSVLFLCCEESLII